MEYGMEKVNSADVKMVVGSVSPEPAGLKKQGVVT